MPCLTGDLSLTSTMPVVDAVGPYRADDAENYQGIVVVATGC